MGRLLLATNNQGKVREYFLLLRDAPFTLTTLAQEGLKATVDEAGATMEENATLKAKGYAALSQLPTLADDSGLEVEALGGEPGVHSARYAGEKSSDRERIEYLLAKLDGVPLEERRARFRCVIAIATPSSLVELCEGKCEGVIAREPKGELGFGYDPIFYLPNLGKTMAELPLELKNEISHRGKAARLALPILKRLAMGKKA